MPTILVTAILALGAGFFFLSRKRKDGGGNWVRFYSKGREAGFSFKEIELLRHLATQCEFEDPCSLYTVQNQLDECIRSLVRTIRMSGETEDQGNQDFLSKLYDYRKKIEMNKPSVRNGINNSRQISEGQTLKLLVAGTGVFKSQIVKNTSQSLTISRPVNVKNTSVISWVGTKISVYFQRNDDAGYVFDTVVQDEVFSKGISSLKIAHNESLFRTQKRKSIRIKMNKAAFLYLIPEDEPSHRLEMDPGLKCFLEDLSDTGCAVTIGGKANSGLRIKVQFALNNTPICMSGTVRSVSFRDETNRSILRMESDILSIETRNHILGEVFGMSPEDSEDDLPFRVLDDEAINTGTNEAAPENSMPVKDPEFMETDIRDDGDV